MKALLHKGIYRGWIIGLAVLLVIVWQPGSADALDCAVEYDIEKNVESYDGIVLARVDRVSSSLYPTTDKKLRLTVERSFKSVQQEKLQVWEDQMWGSSVEGERYLFFLRKTAGGWENQLCSATRIASRADEDLAYLADYELPITEKGTDRQWNWQLYGGGVLIVVLLVGMTILVRRRRRR